MKTLKRILFFSIITFFISCILMTSGIVTANNILAETKPAKVAVFLLDFTDDLIQQLGKT